MAKLGSEKRPIIVRVHTEEKGREVAEACAEHGWHYIIGLEPDEPEDISDLERALAGTYSWRRRQVVMIPVRAAAAGNINSVAEEISL